MLVSFRRAQGVDELADHLGDRLAPAGSLRLGASHQSLVHPQRQFGVHDVHNSNICTSCQPCPRRIVLVVDAKNERLTPEPPVRFLPNANPWDTDSISGCSFLSAVPAQAGRNYGMRPPNSLNSLPEFAPTRILDFLYELPSIDELYDRSWSGQRTSVFVHFIADQHHMFLVTTLT